MLKLLFSISILIAAFFNSNAYCKCTDRPIRIGVIDTGFGFNGYGAEAHLCKYGHKDFSKMSAYIFINNILVPQDILGHGTNVTGIIEHYAQLTHTNYCIVVIKYHAPMSFNNLKATIEALNYASDLKLDYVNYSSGGERSSKEEYDAVERYLNGGGKLIVAAGNNGENLDYFFYNYYPAKYDKRIVIVGALDNKGNIMKMSNYGKTVTRWELGTNVSAYNITLSGTSMATAVATGRIVSQSKNKCDIGD